MQKREASTRPTRPGNRTLPRLLSALSLLVGLHAAHAGPWIAPGDSELRHHLQLLADAGLLTTPITTWPLPWASIQQELDSTAARGLPDSLLWSLQYVRFAANRQTGTGIRAEGRLELAQERRPLRTFDDSRRERNELSASLDWVGSRFAVHLAGSAVDSPLDGEHYRPDGSYVAALIGNWAISAGWQERWWGPGWQSSLILSTNARPVPALALQRNRSDAFETPWLAWIGPWQLTAFAGQMEEAFIPDTKLLGLRVTAKPHPSIELGLSRTAQWGGEGRPQNLSSLWDLISGQDNVGSGGITRENEPGNQLAGIDGRWSFRVGSTSNALYAQVIGEDESGALPSRNIYLAGLESAFTSRQWSHRIALETAATASGGYGSSRPNYTYEHGTYLDGYRHLGRPIGAAFDNDSESVALLGEHFRDNGHQLSWSLTHLDLNRDDSNRAAPGGSRFGDERQKLVQATIGYGIPFADTWKVTVGAELYDKKLMFHEEEIDSTLFLKLECRL